jgi:predicted nuclease of predicted toxin-antitoxin system
MDIRLYLDEDSMDQRLVRALRARGMDVETALDADMVAQPDEEHLKYAAQADRVLHTFNVSDFYDLHTQFSEAGRTHTGLVLGSQQRYTVGEQMRRLLRLKAERTASDMKSRVVFLASL